ncbi:MAG: 6-pyruvoyl-tetrahydropterin synthase-related protein [Caldilineaceae bacterium]
MPTRLIAWFARIDPYLVLLLILSLLALTPLAAPGYFYEAHDGRHSVFYLQMFDASFRSGALWPRWAMHHIQGYGYPTFMIQAPLGFYVGELFILLGAGITLAAKLTWMVGFLAGAWGIYRLVLYWIADAETQAGDLANPRFVDKLDSARLCAVVAGLLYVFIPYHLVDIYVRAALNDALLLAWFPWVFLAFDRLLTQGGAPGWTRRLAVATLLLGGTLLTHTFALISFAPLVVTFVLFLLLYTLRHRSARPGPVLGRVTLGGFAGVAALLLTSIFLLPLLLEAQRYLEQQVYVTNTYDFRRHFVQLGQYFSPFWGFGYSDDPVGANDGMSFQVGLLPLLLSLAALLVPWPQPRLRWLAIYLGGTLLLLLFLMSPWALPIWEAVPSFSVIQFPWRLLALVALLVSALGGLTLYQLLIAVEDEAATVGVLVIGFLVIMGSSPYLAANLQPVAPWREDGRAVYQFEHEHPDMIAYTTWVQEKPFTTSPMSEDYAAPEYTETHGYTTNLTRLVIIRGVGDVVSNYSFGSRFGGLVRLARAGTVRVHLYYFPGWQVTVDGQPAFFQVSLPYGLIEIDLPAGEHRIDVRMGWTPVRLVGAVVSGAVLLVVLVLLVWPVRQAKQE